MNDETAIQLARGFLEKEEIGFVKPGRIGKRMQTKLEVVFPVPETLDPNVAVVDPPDVRVWVNTESEVIELIPQM